VTDAADDYSAGRIHLRLHSLEIAKKHVSSLAVFFGRSSSRPGGRPPSFKSAGGTHSLILVKKYHIVQRTGNAACFAVASTCARMERFHKPPRSCSFQHRPETIGLIIAAMTDIKEAERHSCCNRPRARHCERRSTRSTPYRINDSRYERILATSDDVRDLPLKPTGPNPERWRERHIRPCQTSKRVSPRRVGMDDEDSIVAK
jgi:hypothetical protein